MKQIAAALKQNPDIEMAIYCSNGMMRVDFKMEDFKSMNVFDIRDEDIEEGLMDMIVKINKLKR